MHSSWPGCERKPRVSTSSAATATRARSSARPEQAAAFWPWSGLANPRVHARSAVARPRLRARRRRGRSRARRRPRLRDLAVRVRRRRQRRRHARENQRAAHARRRRHAGRLWLPDEQRHLAADSGGRARTDRLLRQKVRRLRADPSRCVGGNGRGRAQRVGTAHETRAAGRRRASRRRDLDLEHPGGVVGPARHRRSSPS